MPMTCEICGQPTLNGVDVCVACEIYHKQHVKLRKGIRALVIAWREEAAETEEMIDIHNERKEYSQAEIVQEVAEATRRHADELGKLVR